VDPVPDAGAFADLGAGVDDGGFVDKHIQGPRFKVKGARKKQRSYASCFSIRFFR
jgi:hypothetical protein